MPVLMVRNNQPGPTVLSSDPKGTHYVEWQGKGDPNGGDIQPVPEEIQSTVSFQKAVRKHILTLMDAEDTETTAAIEEAMRRQQQEWDHRASSTQTTANEVIEHQTNKDIVALKCVGPSSRGDSSVRCGADVSVRDGQKDERPPLCNLHADLAPQYIPEQVIADGKSVTQWVRMTMGARERQQ